MSPLTSSTRNTPYRDRIAAVALLALAVGFFGLSSWQWQRAAESRAIHERFGEAGGLPSLTVLPPDADLAEVRDREVVLQGRYRPAIQFLLDNMTRQGAAGYHVLTPFQPEGHERLVIVNRGWVAASADRRILPDVPVEDTDRTIRAHIGTLPRPGLRLAAPPLQTDGSALQVVSFPTMQELGERLATPLAAFQLLLAEDQADGFVRAWEPAALPPERHLGYAVQWFALALFVAGASTVVFIRSFRERKK